MAGQKKALVQIVDDDTDVHEFIKAVLSEIGEFEVVSTFDGESGLAAAKSQTPDLIILDVTMPKMDGFRVFYELRQDKGLEQVPVIMFTGVSSQTGQKLSAKDMGEFYGKEPAAFLDKPVQPERMQSAIRSALNI